MEFNITESTVKKEKPADEKNLGFGKLFTDHMFIAEYDEGKGWHDGRIVPYGPLSIDPASPVLHYGQEIFEGLKAFKSGKGDILIFRPKDNARRMGEGAERMCMPKIEEDIFLDGIKALIDIDRDWVPGSPGTSLYIRPTLIADGSALGVHAAKRYLFYVICSPSGAYYAKGLAPISIFVEDKYVRAVKGGVGFAKTGGNYAASIKAAEEAGKKGFDQILWLDGVERKYVEEVGAMNIMFVMGDTLCTPELQGSILSGITRLSVLQMAKDWGMKVEERRISIDELLEANKKGELKEVFGTGTAAVISPVGQLTYKDTNITVNGGEIGPVTQRLYDTLTGIQRGDIEDTYGWTVRV